MKENNLILLIKSLSKSEKRYFKLNSSIVKTNKKLIQLFDLIESDKITDERKLKERLNLGTLANLRVLESRLQSLILKHIRNFHSNNSQSIELNNLISEIEILYGKRLFKNCHKLILKGKKIAEQTDNHLALLNLLKWESFIEKEEGKYLQPTQEKLKVILEKEQKVIKDYSKLAIAKYDTFNLLLLSKNRAIAQLNKELIEYEKRISKKHFDITQEDSFDIKVYKLNFLGMYFLSNHNYKSCLKQYDKLIALFEESDRKNILKSNEYFLALNNQLLMLVMNKEFLRYENTLKKIYTQFENEKAYQPLLFNITQCYELGAYCEIAEIDKGAKILPIIESNFVKFKKDANEISNLLFYLNLGIMYYFNSNYSKSIYWLNIFLNDFSIKKSKVNSNVYYYAHLINLVVHFDAKNYDSISYLYRESINNLLKIRPLNKFDKTILEFIKNQSDTPKTEQKLIEEFKKLEISLAKITKEPNQTIALHFFDFNAWIESRISNKPIHVIIKNKRLG